MRPRPINIEQFEVGAKVNLHYNYWPASRGYSKQCSFTVPADPKAALQKLVDQQAKKADAALWKRNSKRKG